MALACCAVLAGGPLWGLPGFAVAGDKIPADLFAMDALVAPNQEALISAKLERGGRGKSLPATGEPLELLFQEKVVGQAVTDGTGRAVFRYTPKAKGNMSFTIRIAESSSMSATAAVTVAAWERRTPLLAVELAALEESPETHEAIADAAEEIGKLTLFYYNVLYVVPAAGGENEAFHVGAQTRTWLATHRFPPGHVLVVSPADGAFGPKLDELRAAGWTTLKVGVGRTRQFAEVFVQRRLDAVMVPEPAKNDRLKKAKVAKTWKEVRKKL